MPALLFVLAVIIALARRQGSVAERLLEWILLLPIGVTGLWAGIYHVFFPEIAAAHIGWLVSPFQFEVGMADLAKLNRAKASAEAQHVASESKRRDRYKTQCPHLPRPTDLNDELL